MFVPRHLPSPFSHRRSEILFGLTLAVAISLAAIVQSVAGEIKDATGRMVTVGEGRRIVTIGGDVTEIVYALGAGERVIARDSTSLYPEGAVAKPDIGYMRQLSAEGVLSVKPDLILAVEGSGPPDVITLLNAASVPFVVVPERHSAAGIGEKIRLIGAVLGEEAKASQLEATLAGKFKALDTALAKLPASERRKGVFVMNGGGRPLVAGSGTAANAILTMAGALNPMASVDGYKPASDEALMAASPETIVMMSRGGGPDPTAESVFAAPAFAGTPAAKSKSLIVMDGLYLLGFGPRTADAVRDLAHVLYPALALPDHLASN